MIRPDFNDEQSCEARYFAERFLFAPATQAEIFRVRTLLHAAGARLPLNKFEILKQIAAANIGNPALLEFLARS